MLALRVAARLTAREALAVGVNWTYAPVADLDLEPTNPIVGTRSLGRDPDVVAAAVTEMIDALQGEGMLACAKHFPGHGRTTTDSHAVLPVVHATREELQVDLSPFVAAIDAGVASIMTAHVAYPALDPSGAPATCSPAIVNALLREELGFEGLIVTDALVMGGVQDEGGEGHTAARALAAGCDLLLYPSSPRAALHGLEVAAGRSVPRHQLDASLARRDHWARWAATPERAKPILDSDRAEGDAIIDRAVHVLRGTIPPLGPRIGVAIVDDDLGGPYPPPSRQPLLDALGRAGVAAQLETHPGAGSRPLVIALFGDIQGVEGASRLLARRPRSGAPAGHHGPRRAPRRLPRPVLAPPPCRRAPGRCPGAVRLGRGAGDAGGGGASIGGSLGRAPPALRPAHGHDV